MGILVSINCITYNHENYIAKAIEGFLMQKTDFEYEVLIGEDCSTDGTKKIVESYVEKYPNIVKMITAEKNVGMRENNLRLKRVSQGEYIALCEGDDYWTDPLKLQKQMDFFRAHPECSMVFHAADIEDVIKKEMVGSIRPYKKTCLLPSERFFFGGGDTVPTASILYKRDIMAAAPSFIYDCTVGDHPLAMILSYHGRVGYIDEVMSVRTLWVPGSWNTRYHQDKQVEKHIYHTNSIIQLLENYDKYTNYKYTNEIKKHIFNGKIQIACLKGIKPFSDQDCKAYLKNFSTFQQIKMKVGYRLPSIQKRYSQLKEFIKSKVGKA